MYARRKSTRKSGVSAAAGSPYYPKKRPVFRKRTAIPKAISPYSAGFVHKFKRHQSPYYIYALGGGAFAAGNVTDISTAPANVLVGTAVADGLMLTYDVPFTPVFRLNDVNNNTEFTVLFDSFRITGVSVKITYAIDTAAIPIGGGTAAMSIPSIYSVEDYDDGTLINNLNEIQDFSTMKVSKLSNERVVTRYVKPRAALYSYKTSGTTFGYAQAPTTQWFDCTNNDTEYYGLKFWLSNIHGNTTKVPAIKVETAYYLEFKNPR